MIYKKELEKIYNSIRDRRDDLQSEVSNLPEGELYIRSDDKQKQYFQRLPKGGNRKKEHRYGIKKQPELLKALSRKAYIDEVLPILDKDLKEIGKLLDKYKATDEESVMGDFLEKYPELSDGVYHGRRESGNWSEWQSAEQSFHPESLKSTASDGSGRRSVGELLIGAKLKHYKIPYRYEVPAHPDLPYIPDFTVKRPRDGKIFFWEHFGLVNDKEYMERNRRKLLDYERVGIVPWENLIITYNQSDGGINEKLIDAMIEGWLL